MDWLYENSWIWITIVVIVVILIIIGILIYFFSSSRKSKDTRRNLERKIKKYLNLKTRYFPKTPQDSSRSPPRYFHGHRIPEPPTSRRTSGYYHRVPKYSPEQYPFHKRNLEENSVSPTPLRRLKEEWPYRGDKYRDMYEKSRGVTEKSRGVTEKSRGVTEKSREDTHKYTEKVTPVDKELSPRTTPKSLSPQPSERTKRYVVGPLPKNLSHFTLVDDEKEYKWSQELSYKYKGKGRGENILRAAFEDIYGVEFPNTRPEWLINPETGRRLEIDCLGQTPIGLIAGEYQGKQHYHFKSNDVYFYKSEEEFINQIRRDEFKKETLEKMNIPLIIVPYTVKYSEIGIYLLDRLREIGLL